MSDLEHSTVTYTSISSDADSLAWAVDFFGLLEPKSPEAVPLSSDYVPGLMEPDQPLLLRDYMSGPKYPEYLAHLMRRNYNPKGERILIASRFPTPPLAYAFFSLRATEPSSSKLAREQTSNPTSSTNPTPKEAIIVPPIIAEQFELKHSLINMMTSEQFFGLEKDNPHDHVRTARRWLEKEPPHSITTWDDLQTSAVTTAMTAMLKQFQSNPPPAQVKAVEEICVTCGGAHLYYQCLAVGGNTFPKFQDNIQEEDECVEETYTDPDHAEYTIKVPPPPPVQKLKPPIQRNFVLHTRNSLPLHISYPSRMLKQKQQEKDDIQIQNTTFLANSLLEEFADELSLISYPPDYDDNRACDIESDIREIEFLLYQGQDSNFKDSIDQYVLTHCDDLFVDPTPEMFIDEQPPDYSFPPRFDVYPHDFLEIKSDATFDDDSFDLEGEKIKEAELLIDQLNLLCDILSEYDSFAS
nr:hypothetical protein [Tanacetum cinerariifolium]